MGGSHRRHRIWILQYFFHNLITVWIMIWCKFILLTRRTTLSRCTGYASITTMSCGISQVMVPLVRRTIVEKRRLRGETVFMQWSTPLLRDFMVLSRCILQLGVDSTYNLHIWIISLDGASQIIANAWLDERLLIADEGIYLLIRMLSEAWCVEFRVIGLESLVSIELVSVSLLVQ